MTADDPFRYLSERTRARHGEPEATAAALLNSVTPPPCQAEVTKDGKVIERTVLSQSLAERASQMQYGTSGLGTGLEMVSDVGQPALVAVETDGTGFRFVGPTERVDVQNTHQFMTLDHGEIDAILGRKVHFDQDGKPIMLGDAEHQTMKAALFLRHKIVLNPSMSSKDKRRTLHRLRRENIQELRDQKRDLGTQLRQHDDAIDRIDRQAQVVREMIDWLDRPPILSRPDGSQFANALADHYAQRLIFPLLPADTEYPTHLKHALNADQTFVVEHDWSAVFKDAKIESADGDTSTGEIALPYEFCCYEFVIGGQRICAVMNQNDSGIVMVPLIKFKAGWAMIATYRITDSWRAVCGVDSITDAPVIAGLQPFIDIIAMNVRAIAISLEAKVTQTEIVRVPTKLNAARAKRGKLPLLDYHVVSLARRSRPAPLPADHLDPNREITRKRLHFRRGHWRHYENHRTWIKWCLVGDPDLGFIDKHYRL